MWCKNKTFFPSAAIMSTARDMGRWVYMLLNNGNIDKTQVIDPDVIAKNWIPVNVRHNNDDESDIQRPRYVNSVHSRTESTFIFGRKQINKRH